MSTLDERRDSFEKKYAHDEALLFKAMARRNKLLGLWAAEKMGLNGAEAEAYAKDLVMTAIEDISHSDIGRRVLADFDAAKVAQSEHQVQRTMDEFLSVAVAQIKAA